MINLFCNIKDADELERSQFWRRREENGRKAEILGLVFGLEDVCVGRDVRRGGNVRNGVDDSDSRERGNGDRGREKSETSITLNKVAGRLTPRCWLR